MTQIPTKANGYETNGVLMKWGQGVFSDTYEFGLQARWVTNIILIQRNGYGSWKTISGMKALSSHDVHSELKEL